MPLFIGIHGSSTCSLVNNGGHRLQLIQQWWLPIVNGWCQPFAAHAMATTQQSFAALYVLGLFVPKIIENVEKCPIIYYRAHSVCALVSRGGDFSHSVALDVTCSVAFWHSSCSCWWNFLNQSEPSLRFLQFEM